MIGIVVVFLGTLLLAESLKVGDEKKKYFQVFGKLLKRKLPDIRIFVENVANKIRDNPEKAKELISKFTKHLFEFANMDPNQREEFFSKMMMMLLQKFHSDDVNRRGGMDFSKVLKLVLNVVEGLMEDFDSEVIMGFLKRIFEFFKTKNKDSNLPFELFLTELFDIGGPVMARRLIPFKCLPSEEGEGGKKYDGHLDIESLDPEATKIKFKDKYKDSNKDDDGTKTKIEEEYEVKRETKVKSKKKGKKTEVKHEEKYEKYEKSEKQDRDETTGKKLAKHKKSIKIKCKYKYEEKTYAEDFKDLMKDDEEKEPETDENVDAFFDEMFNQMLGKHEKEPKPLDVDFLKNLGNSLMEQDDGEEAVEEDKKDDEDDEEEAEKDDSFLGIGIGNGTMIFLTVVTTVPILFICLLVCLFCCKWICCDSRGWRIGQKNRKNLLATPNDTSYEIKQEVVEI